MGGKKQRRAKPARAEPVEDRRAVAVTVAWMLTMLAALGAQLAALATGLLVSLHPERVAPQVKLLPPLLWLIGLLMGTLCLLLTVPVHRFRHTPPPRAVTAFAVLVGVAPWLALLVLWVLWAVPLGVAGFCLILPRQEKMPTDLDQRT